MQAKQQVLIQKLQAAVNLASIMPPSKMKKNLIGLINLAGEIEDNLYEKIDQPLEICRQAKQPFLQTELNREGDNFRCPYDNNYYPQSEQGYVPSQKFKRLQQMGNLLFTEYTKLYYGGDVVSNFFVLQNESQDKFSCGFFAKKQCSKQSNQDGFSGNWDSFNIVDVKINGNRATYNLNSTVLLEMDIDKKTCGHIDLTGFLKKSKSQVRDLSKCKQQQIMEFHISVIGELVQDVETSIRQYLQAVYVARTKEVIFKTRYEQTRASYQSKYKLAQQLKSVRFNNKESA